MIHISKLSPFRVNNVEDILKQGESVEVDVIEIDKEKGRIGLKRVISAEEMAKFEESRKPKEVPVVASTVNPDEVKI
jgi:polyribonucleotide nucleotidyltransferase